MRLPQRCSEVQCEGRMSHRRNESEIGWTEGRSTPMTTATEEHGHDTTEELAAELEEVRRELEAKRRSSGGWHLLAVFTAVIAVAAFVAVILGSNDKQTAVTAMHSQMNGAAMDGGMMGSGSGTATSQ